MSIPRRPPYRRVVATEAAELEAALYAAGHDPDAPEAERIWDIWLHQGLGAALAALAQQRIARMNTALHERRAALAQEAGQAQAAHQAAITDLAAGTGTAAQVAKLAAPAAALTAALAALDAQIAANDAHDAQESQAAARQTQIAQLVAQSQAAAAARAQFEAAYLSGAAALEQAIVQMLASMAAWSESRGSFLGTLRELAPGLHSLSYRSDPAAEQALDALLDELASVGADLPAGLARGWWAGRMYREYDHLLPPASYGGLLVQGFNHARGTDVPIRPTLAEPLLQVGS